MRYVVFTVLMLTAAPMVEVTAETVSVAGVTIHKENSARAKGVLVVLASSKNHGKSLADDSSSEVGVYNLSCDGVQGDVESLWVICSSDIYVGRPVAVTLGRANRGVRTAKVQDMEVIQSQGRLDEVSALWSLVAIEETEAVKMKAGLTSRDDAIARALSQFKSIVGRLPRDLQSEEQLIKILDKSKNEYRKEIVDRVLIDRDVIKKLRSSRPE